MTEEKEKTKSSKGISRRQFITGTVGGVVVGAAVGAVAGSLGFPKTITVQAGLPTKWDYQTDVVVIGSGGAGMSAALGALESSAKVIILEKAGAVGGTTAISGGEMWIPNNSLMTAAGLSYPQSDVLQYFDAIGGGEQEEDLINTYVNEGPVWIDHLVNDLGMKASNGTTFNAYYNVAGVYMGTVGPGVQPSGNGAGLIAFLKTAVDGKGATTMLNTPGTGLYRDSTGRIVGVQATSNGATVNISAAKGVVLAAGGYDFDPEMMQNYPRGPILGSGAVKTNTGDCIKMAMDVGADIRNMNNNWGLPVYVTPDSVVLDWAEWRTKPGAIIVNSAGKRFVNESAAYAVANRAFLAWDTKIYGYPNIPAYTIMDSDAFNAYGLAGVIPKGTIPSWMTTANSLQELAAALNIDPDGLQATVTQFNTYALNGIDPDFNRGVFVFDQHTGGDPTRTDLKNDCLAPLQTPPFYAAAISPGTCGTCGGPRINSNSQVLDKQGNPIPGLYGAGNDISAPFGAGYPGGGGTVGPATVFGWIAGKSAGSS